MNTRSIGIIVGVLLLLGLVAGLSYFAGSNSNQNDSTNQSQTTQTISPTPTATPAASATPTNSNQNNIPSEVRNYIETEYPEHYIDDLDTEMVDGATGYKIELEREGEIEDDEIELFYSSDWQLIRTETD